MGYLSSEFLKQYENVRPKNAGLLFDVVFLRTYARYKSEEKRRERWDETVARVVEHSFSLYPVDGPASYKELEEEAKYTYDKIFNLEVLPAGRSLWIAGTRAAEKHPSALFNCAYLDIDSLEAFCEVFHLLLNGCGVGFGIRKEDISKLPSLNFNIELIHDNYNPLQKNERLDNTVTSQIDNVFVIKIGDSREGWVEALRNYLNCLRSFFIKKIVLNYDYIRQKGERILTFGGRAPGPEGLKEMFKNIHRIIQNNEGCLNSLACLDINNFIAKNVIVGGTRRSSQIAFGDKDDYSFIEAKKDLWVLKENLQRTMSNNSIAFWDKPSKEELSKIFDNILENGEPGLWNWRSASIRRGSTTRGSNPCNEILLDSRQFCNLTTVNWMAHINSNGEIDQKKLIESIKLATRIGLRQTNVTVELKEWDYKQKRDRLLGVSMTGIMDAIEASGRSFYDYIPLLQRLRNATREEARKYAYEMRVPEPLLITCIKPEGCWTKEFIRTTDNGLLFIDEINEKINEKQGFSDVRKFNILCNGRLLYKTYNKGLSEILRVVLKNGRLLKITPQHPMAINKIGWWRTCWVKGVNLKPGMELVYELGTYKKETESRLLSISIKDCRSDAFDALLPEFMSPDLAWLIGLYYGDGCFTSNNRIKLIGRDEKVHLKAQRLWWELFGIKTNIIKCPDREGWTQDFVSVKIRRWLNKNGLDKSSYDYLERIPKEIRISSYRSVVAFIAGLSDADGCYYANSMCIDNKSEKFIRHLQEIGEAVGISFGFSINSSRNNSYNKKPLYKIHLSRAYSLESAINLLNEYSVKAQDKPIIKSFSINKAGINPYTIKAIELQDEYENAYDVSVEGDHWYYQGGLKSHNTLSQLPTVSSGLHKNYAPYYIRRIRVSSIDPVCLALQKLGVPNEPDQGKNERIVFSFPIKSQTKISQAEEKATEQFNKYLVFMANYVDHNASITIQIDKNEKDEIVDMVDKQWDNIVGCAFLPKYTDAYPQMPYEEITEQQYNDMIKNFPDLTDLYYYVNMFENEDEEYELDESDCKGGYCPVR